MPIIWSPDALRVSSSVKSPAPTNLDARVGQTALGELFGEDTGLRAREINKRCVRMDVADALQKRGKIRISERDANRLDDLASGVGETGFKGGLRFNSWSPIVD
jgi:hypothetical protein